MKFNIECIGIQEAFVTCIIPFRISYNHIDNINRLNHIKLDCNIPDIVNFCIVDDGTPYELRDSVKNKCIELGYAYIYIDSTLEEFSIARCRNIGAMYAKSKFIFIQDVDLMPYDGFYKDIINEIYIQGLDYDAKKFLMVPYIFLTKYGSDEFINNSSKCKHNLFMHKAIVNDPDYIEKISCGTSANLFNRIWYLSRGGNSIDFVGWGYEDLECNTRMIRHLNFFPTPRNWQTQKYNFSNVLQYDTWKAVYRLYGDLLFYKGIVLFHRYHSREKNSYTERENVNRAIFIKKMSKFISSKEEPDALPDMNAGRTLLLKRNAFTFSRSFRPFLGDIIVPSTDLIDGTISLERFVIKNNIDRVIFHNPYNDNRMYELYVEARSKNIKYYICERGALPDSHFFDDTGFLLDSKYYKENMWNHDISYEFREKTIQYIKELRASSYALETQNDRQPPEVLRKKLKIHTFEKVLLIVFQRPEDSVVVNFAGELCNYSNFVTLVQDVAKNIPTNWKILAKKHPLEEDIFDMPNNVKYVNDIHIHDLLEISDAMMTFNSGVGILSMIFGVPSVICGNAFYQNDNINIHLTNYTDIISYISSPPKYDPEYRIRFISYLINEIYSFGKFITKNVKMPNGKNMTATRDIISYDIKFEGNHIKFSDNKKSIVGWESLLFDRYRYFENNMQSNQTLHSICKNNTKSEQIDTKKSEQIDTKKSEQIDTKKIETYALTLTKHKKESAILKKFLSEKKYKKYLTDRNAFFNDSKNLFVRLYYLINQ